MKLVTVLLFLALGCTAPAQTINTFDSSGNGLLNGTYFFRDVTWVVGDNAGNLARGIALTGTMNFDGNGNYVLTCKVLFDSDGEFGCPSGTIAGLYRISASGFGYVSNPFPGAGFWFGMVSHGAFIASTTEDGNIDGEYINNLMVAAPAGSASATNASVSGSYWVASMDFPSGAVAASRDALFRLDADGAGNVATVNATGYIGSGANPVTQALNGVKYSFSNGIGTLTYGGTLTATNLLAGSKQMFVSADGNVLLGGSITGFDMFVGIRASSDSKDSFSGLYYQAGVTEDGGNLQTYYGAFNVDGKGTVVGHQRIFSVFSDAYDFSYSDHIGKNDDGSFSDNSGFRYALGTGGAITVGISAGPVPAINIALQAPAFSASGSSVYILPIGVVNAASSAPFTTGVSRGELISLYGSNLASTTLVDGTFPATLGGVVVLINNRPARIYVVSPTQISVLVPFGTTEAIAQIQVISNGNVSNVVTMLVRATAPGAFTNPTGGVGYAAALHPDFSVVTPKNPAKEGETIALYVTGLGDVTPAIPDGAIAPGDPLSKTTANMYAFIGGKQATTVYSGLAPGLIGLYQLNVTIPAGVGTGDVRLDLSTASGYSSEALIPMASAP